MCCVCVLCMRVCLTRYAKIDHTYLHIRMFMPSCMNFRTDNFIM